MTTGIAQRKISSVLPNLKTEGVPFVVAAPVGGTSVQFKKITATTTSLQVVFKDHGMHDMADTNYAIGLGGETAGRITVDESTITTSGFTILTTANTEVIHITVTGRLAGQGY